MNPKKTRSMCLNCGAEVQRLDSKFCNHTCFNYYQYKQYIESWLAGNETGQTSNGLAISNHIRRWLFETHNNSCQLCGWNKRSLFTGKVPLEIHHIDGNHLNNLPSNLQLLCPNCHSLTSTHGSLNKGNGRPYTRVRK